MKKFKRLPQHFGIIPDGNRRWSQNKGLEKKTAINDEMWPDYNTKQIYRALAWY